MDALGADIASQIGVKNATAYTAVTAAGAGDATEIVGASIDITALPQRPNSVCFAVPCEATLTAAKTLTVIGDIETSADGTNWDQEVASATLLTLTATGNGVAKVGCRLNKTNVRYVRLNITPDLSHTSTDTAKIGGGIAIFGGLGVLPATF